MYVCLTIFLYYYYHFLLACCLKKSRHPIFFCILDHRNMSTAMAMHDLETAGRLNLNNLQSMAPAPTTAAAESAAAILENVEEVTIQNPTTTQTSPNEAGENHSTSLSSDDHASRVSYIDI